VWLVDFEVRRASLEDAGRVARVYVASWNEGFGPLLPRRVLTSEQVARWERQLDFASLRWWVAERAGSLLGFAGTGPSRDPIDPHLGELDTIAVDPTAWRQGVGRRLMGMALSDLVGGGYREGIVWTLADHRPARLFYEATGWHVSGEVRDRGRQIALRRSLDA
jgi:GNAT superfamily N-acetyltransferase